MHCVKKYWIKSWALLLPLTLLCFLHWKWWIAAVPCAPSVSYPSPASQPSWDRIPILVINHIKTLIQFVLPHFFLPVLMLFHPFWQRISFWQRGKLAHGVHWEFYVVLWVMVSPLFPQDNIVCDVGWSLTVAEHCFMVRPLTLQGSTSCGTSKGGDDFVCELRVVHPSWNTHRWTEHCSSASSACGAWVHL